MSRASAREHRLEALSCICFHGFCFFIHRIFIVCSMILVVFFLFGICWLNLFFSPYLVFGGPYSICFLPVFRRPGRPLYPFASLQRPTEKRIHGKNNKITKDQQKTAGFSDPLKLIKKHCFGPRDRSGWIRLAFLSPGSRFSARSIG